MSSVKSKFEQSIWNISQPFEKSCFPSCPGVSINTSLLWAVRQGKQKEGDKYAINHKSFRTGTQQHNHTSHFFVASTISNSYVTHSKPVIILSDFWKINILHLKVKQQDFSNIFKVPHRNTEHCFMFVMLKFQLYRQHYL